MVMTVNNNMPLLDNEIETIKETIVKVQEKVELIDSYLEILENGDKQT